MSGLYLVHGFWSSAGTWSEIIAALAQDRDLDFLKVNPYEYPSPRIRAPLLATRIPDFNDVAQAFLTTLENDASRPLGIVAHSQGGLIVQRFLARMLGEGRGNELERIKLIVMLASPHEGSDYLRSIRKTLRFGRHAQARDLGVLREAVADCRRTVLRQIVNAKTVGPSSCPIPIYAFSGQSDRIVPRSSAQSTFPDAGVLPGDHFSIIKPRTRGNVTIPTLKRLILQHMPPIAVASFARQLQELHKVCGAPSAQALAQAGYRTTEDELASILSTHSSRLPLWSSVQSLLIACHKLALEQRLEVNLGSVQDWWTRFEAAQNGLILPSPIGRADTTIHAPTRPRSNTLTSSELRGVIEEAATLGSPFGKYAPSATTPVMGIATVREIFRSTRAMRGTQLLILDDRNVDSGVRRWLTERPLFVIGRDETCDLVLSDPRVSLRHVEMWREEDELWCRDLDSTNGTYFNEYLIDPAEPRVVGAKDRLVIGPYTVIWLNN